MSSIKSINIILCPGDIINLPSPYIYIDNASNKHIKDDNAITVELGKGVYYSEITKSLHSSATGCLNLSSNPPGR